MCPAPDTISGAGIRNLPLADHRSIALPTEESRHMKQTHEVPERGPFAPSPVAPPLPFRVTDATVVRLRLRHHLASMRKELAHWSEEKWCTYSEACIESQILLPKNPEVEEAERQVEQAREARALAREREATLDGRVRHEKWQVADKILGGRVMEVPWEELDEAFDDAIEHPDMAELVGELETATEERWKADSEMADALSRLGALRSGDEDSGFCQVYDLIVWDNLRCVEGVARGSQAHHRMRGSKRQARPNTASRTRGSRRCAPRSSSDDSDPGGGEPPGEPAPSTGGQHKTEGQVVA